MLFFSTGQFVKPSDLPTDFFQDSLRATISDEANQCVSCGLCLPHCPTYRVTLSEADSPRGRIALISGVASDRLPMNERFVEHMDRCLTCRACEVACPNQVQFGQLIDEARTMINSSPFDLGKGKTGKRKSRVRRWLEKEFLAEPLRIDALRPFLRFYQRSGLQKWVRKSGLLGKTRLALLEAQLPLIDKPRASSMNHGSIASWRSVYPAIGKSRGNVGLFLGCVARLADVTTINSAIFVLNRLGYTVYLPRSQTCCGALHRHSGDMRFAGQLEQQNVRAFDGLNLSAIISTASGCGVQLAEYSFFSPSQRARGAHQIKRGSIETPPPKPPAVMDVSAFLATAEGWDDVQLATFPNKILVHEPCSLRNVLRGSAHSYALLRRIPGARVASLPGNDQCCGAAGTYFIDQPEIAKALLEDKTAALAADNARYLATSNVGCAMYIASGLREAGLSVEVIHPVTLIARQMGIQS